MRTDARVTDDESSNSVTSHGRQTSSLFTNEPVYLAARGEIGRHVYPFIILSIEQPSGAAVIRLRFSQDVENVELRFRCSIIDGIRCDSKISDFSLEIRLSDGIIFRVIFKNSRRCFT